MNPSAMPSIIRIFALACAAPLAACNISVPGDAVDQPPLEQAPLYGSAIKGGFELTDEDGKARNWTDWDGKWRIVYFGYAYCPDYCPNDVGTFSRGLKKFAAEHPGLAADIQPLFVSVDPDRDTPEVLKEFTDAFDPDLVGLTGTQDQLHDAAANFFVQYAKDKQSEGGGYLMEHTTITYLFAPDGDAIATLPTDQGADAVAAELAKWVR